MQRTIPLNSPPPLTPGHNIEDLLANQVINFIQGDGNTPDGELQIQAANIELSQLVEIQKKISEIKKALGDLLLSSTHTVSTANFQAANPCPYTLRLDENTASTITLLAQNLHKLKNLHSLFEDLKCQQDTLSGTLKTAWESVVQPLIATHNSHMLLLSEAASAPLTNSEESLPALLDLQKQHGHSTQTTLSKIRAEIATITGMLDDNDVIHDTLTTELDNLRSLFGALETDQQTLTNPPSKIRESVMGYLIPKLVNHMHNHLQGQGHGSLSSFAWHRLCSEIGSAKCKPNDLNLIKATSQPFKEQERQIGLLHFAFRHEYKASVMLWAALLWSSSTEFLPICSLTLNLLAASIDKGEAPSDAAFMTLTIISAIKHYMRDKDDCAQGKVVLDSLYTQLNILAKLIAILDTEMHLLTTEKAIENIQRILSLLNQDLAQQNVLGTHYPECLRKAMQSIFLKTHLDHAITLMHSFDSRLTSNPSLIWQVSMEAALQTAYSPPCDTLEIAYRNILIYLQLKESQLQPGDQEENEEKVMQIRKAMLTKALTQRNFTPGLIRIAEILVNEMKNLDGLLPALESWLQACLDYERLSEMPLIKTWTRLFSKHVDTDLSLLNFLQTDLSDPLNKDDQEGNTPLIQNCNEILHCNEALECDPGPLSGEPHPNQLPQSSMSPQSGDDLATQLINCSLLPQSGDDFVTQLINFCFSRGELPEQAASQLNNGLTTLTKIQAMVSQITKVLEYSYFFTINGSVAINGNSNTQSLAECFRKLESLFKTLVPQKGSLINPLNEVRASVMRDLISRLIKRIQTYLDTPSFINSMFTDYIIKTESYCKLLKIILAQENSCTELMHSIENLINSMQNTNHYQTVLESLDLATWLRSCLHHLLTEQPLLTIWISVFGAYEKAKNDTDTGTNTLSNLLASSAHTSTCMENCSAIELLVWSAEQPSSSQAETASHALGHNR